MVGDGDSSNSKEKKRAHHGNQTHQPTAPTSGEASSVSKRARLASGSTSHGGGHKGSIGTDGKKSQREDDWAVFDFDDEDGADDDKHKGQKGTGSATGHGGRSKVEMSQKFQGERSIITMVHIGALHLYPSHHL